MNNKQYYSEYLEERKPNTRGEMMLRKWHERLLKQCVTDTSLGLSGRILEIGAGHGYFADSVRKLGISYEYVDLSPAVYQSMSQKKFVGYLGNLSNAPEDMKEYDVVWISHVLEHSPTWEHARQMIEDASYRLKKDGYLIVVSPDLLSSKNEFWSSDWSHGYPTTKRNVVQICSDVGLKLVQTRYHRGAYFGLCRRFLRALVTQVPHLLVDLVISPGRRKTGEGLMYSWKTAFGWRQIYIVVRRVNSN